MGGEVGVVTPLLEKKFLFVDHDMRHFSSEEIEYTIASGLLHCGPSFRTCFSQSTKHFCFIQGNLQEYLAARWFVKRKEVPCRGNTSKMVMRFMAGILSEQNDQVFMEKILEGLVKDVKKDARIPLFIVQCLAEYQDKEFAQNFVRNGHLQSCTFSGGIAFFPLNDVDYFAVTFLLDVFSAINDENDTGKHQKNIYHSLNVIKLFILIQIYHCLD